MKRKERGGEKREREWERGKSNTRRRGNSSQRYEEGQKGGIEVRNVTCGERSTDVNCIVVCSRKGCCDGHRRYGGEVLASKPHPSTIYQCRTHFRDLYYHLPP